MCFVTSFGKHLVAILKNCERRLHRPAVLVLLGIISANVIVRVGYANHLFKWIYDYDEGAYSLGGRFISEGYLPYRDFVLVHPPLYDLTLGALYKVFGYDFFLGRYFSVFLSVCCIILAFLVIKKLFNSTAGLVAAAFIALFPGLFLVWYRAVQEPLGIFFILLGLYFISDFIVAKRVTWHILAGGLCLGLAVSTKYTFIPAVFGLSLGFLLLSGQGKWRTLSGWANKQNILFVAGVLGGFLLVTGYFIAFYPHEYFAQTFSSQVAYRLHADTSGILHVLNAFSLPLWDQKIAGLCIIFVFGMTIATLSRIKQSRVHFFLALSLVVTVLLSSTIDKFGELRYFATPFLFAILGLASFVPELRYQDLTRQLNLHFLKRSVGFALALPLLILSAGGLIVLQVKDFNYMPGGATYEESVYRQAVEYLEKDPTKIVYSMSPLLPALSPNIKSTLEFDTFAFLEIFKQDPVDVLNRQKQAGVGYLTTDALWLLSFQKPEFGLLTLTIMKDNTLLASFTPGLLPIFQINIYETSAPAILDNSK